MMSRLIVLVRPRNTVLRLFSTSSAFQRRDRRHIVGCGPRLVEMEGVGGLRLLQHSLIVAVVGFKFTHRKTICWTPRKSPKACPVVVS